MQCMNTAAQEAVIITLANQKGGVTKTTSTANLAMMLAFAGQRVLVVDCDPQGHLTYTFGFTPDLLEGTLYDAMKDSIAINKAIRPTFFDPATGMFFDPGTQEAPQEGVLAGPHLLAINILASNADTDLQSNPSWGTLLRRKLRTIRHLYDYILIDTNPGLGKLTINAFCAADYVCIPLTPEVLPTQGLVSLAKSIEEARTSEANPDLRIAGIVFTRVKQNYKAHSGIIDYVRQELAPKLQMTCFQTEIKESAAFLNAASTRSVIVVAEPESDHAIIYWHLLLELVQRVNGPGLDAVQHTYQTLLSRRQERMRLKEERAEAKKSFS